MNTPSPDKARQFALEVVDRLRQHGFEAFWAGGCVRDRLLGREAKDYDVATSATPDQVRATFGRRRTLAIGAAFGVISVLGRKDAGQVEVATFRRDVSYSDGRHPDAVAFSTAEEDARRRDFTINGMFFDPLSEQVHDYVGGQDDLARGLVRAIGDPQARFAEDRLRMLRAVRFAATFGFEIEPTTRRAIEQEADSIVVVSAERIAAEMRRMLVHPARAQAIRLLHETSLLRSIAPAVDRLAEQAALGLSEPSAWARTLAVLTALQEPSFPAALAAMLHAIGENDEQQAHLVGELCSHWKLSTDEGHLTAWSLVHLGDIHQAHQLPWARLQRILIQPGIGDLLSLAAAQVACDFCPAEAVAFCREKLGLPLAELNPPLLISGDDLIELGLAPGPRFKPLLDRIRDAQLEGRVTSREDALHLAADFIRQGA